MKRLILLFMTMVLLPTLGCASPVPEDHSRIGYLPDGRMVLLQSSGADRPVT